MFKKEITCANPEAKATGEGFSRKRSRSSPESKKNPSRRYSQVTPSREDRALANTTKIGDLQLRQLPDQKLAVFATKTEVKALEERLEELVAENKKTKSSYGP
ncbi:hypothetical protein AAG570_005878 [Ranatra chinensis]|uniref:Uncharacterized protein n=1 Tax=Ranatra chinensis TaxID=642074 RepID=A0ABD0YBH0_9HEMI